MDPSKSRFLKIVRKVVPTTDDLAQVKPMTTPGVHWEQANEAAIAAKDAAPECAPDITGAVGGYGRKWGLLDDAGGIHGTASIQVE